MNIRMIGHENTKTQIRRAVESARARNVAIPHMLFAGAPGCGKTTMAKEIAKISQASFIKAVPEDMKDYNAVISLLEQLNHTGYDRRGNRIGRINPTVIFFDEIHAMPLKGQEKLGIAMEEWQIESTRTNRFIWLPFFTVIGATTNDGKLSKPFRDRFKLRFVFQTYEEEELTEIVKAHANRMKILISSRAARDIAARSKGTPRIAVGYLERVRDMALSLESKIITSETAKRTFLEMKVDEEGLTETEIKVLKALFNAGTSVGLDNLSIITNESAKTLTESVEPFLIQKGFILRSGKGRVLTPIGRKYVETLYSDDPDVVVKEEIPVGYVRK